MDRFAISTATNSTGWNNIASVSTTSTLIVETGIVAFLIDFFALFLSIVHW